MIIDSFKEIVNSFYLTLLLCVFPIANGILVAARYDKNILKVVLGFTYAGVTMVVNFSIFYFLAFLVFPYEQLASGESNMIRDLIFVSLTLGLCGIITRTFYCFGQRRKISLMGIKDISNHSVLCLFRYMLSVVVFNLGLSILLLMIFNIAEEFYYRMNVDGYLIGLLFKFIIAVLLVIMGFMLFRATYKMHINNNKKTSCTS